MARRTIHMAQTQIPVESFGTKIRDEADREAAYRAEMGDEAFARQRAEWEAAYACKCGSPFPEKWGDAGKHKAGCPRRKRP